MNKIRGVKNSDLFEDIDTFLFYIITPYNLGLTTCSGDIAKACSKNNEVTEETIMCLAHILAIYCLILHNDFCPETAG